MAGFLERLLNSPAADDARDVLGLADLASARAIRGGVDAATAVPDAPASAAQALSLLAEQRVPANVHSQLVGRIPGSAPPPERERADYSGFRQWLEENAKLGPAIHEELSQLGRNYDRAPETTAERYAAAAGDLAGVGAAVAGGTALLARRPASGGFLDRVLVEPFREAPGAATAIEVAAGAASGLGEEAGRDLLSDTDLGEKYPWLGPGVGGLTGGVAAGAMVARRLLGKGARPDGGQPSSAKAEEPSPAANPLKSEGDPAFHLGPKDRAHVDDLRTRAESAREAGNVDEARALDAEADQFVHETNLIDRTPTDVVRDHPEIIELAETRGKQRMASMVADTETRLSQEVHENVVAAMDEVLAVGQVQRSPDRMISDQIMELLSTNKIQPEDFKGILERNNLTQEDFAAVWRVNVRKAAQDLNLLSQAEKRIKALTKEAQLTPEEEALLASPSSDLAAQGFWRRLENVRRGALVTQVSTAMRNIETQMANLGVHALEDAMEAAILKTVPHVEGPRVTDAFGPLMRVFMRKTAKEQADEIMSLFPKDTDSLFMKYSSDLLNAGAGSDLMSKAERGVQALNWLNRFQEYTVRRAVFTATLDRQLRMKGDDLATMIAEGRAGRLDREDVAAATERALEMTFAKEFNRESAKKGERIAAKMIDAVNETSVGPLHATQVIPFPRFLANAVKWQYEHSPLPLMKLAYSPREWRKIADGEIKPLVKATVGTGMLLSAYQVRSDPELAGAKWYQLKLPSGETMDLRPFNPFASYLFAADVVHKSVNGTLDQLTTRDVAMGLFATNLRAGAGMYTLDKMLDGFTTSGDPEEIKLALQGYAGAVGSSYLVPAQQLKDVVAHFDETQRVLRSTEERPFLGPIASKLPYGADALGLPEVELPTRSDPPINRNPLLKQSTGILIRDKDNPIEAELNRLGFTRTEIQQGEGDPKADRLVSKYMGPLVEEHGSALVQSPMYQQASDGERGMMVKQLLGNLRQAARGQAMAEDPELFVELKRGKVGKRKRRLMDEIEFDARSAELESKRREQAGE